MCEASLLQSETVIKDTEDMKTSPLAIKHCYNINKLEII